MSEVRKNHAMKREEGVNDAVDRAIETMPNDYCIKPFLEAHRAEVKGLLSIRAAAAQAGISEDAFQKELRQR